jgi:hypothetical protein
MASQRGQFKKMAVEAPATKRRAARRASSVIRTKSGRAPEAAVPGWDALTHSMPRSAKTARAANQTSLTTARYTLWLTGLALAFTLYVGHVHATQQVYESLHALKKENLHLHLQLDQLRGELDRTAGPAVLYPKARRLGLKEGASYGPTIQIHP